MKDKILSAVRLKYKPLGFSDESITAIVAHLEATVTAEDQIESAVNGLEPALKIVQSEIDRRAAKAKVDALPPAPVPALPPTPAPAGAPEPADDTPAWAKGFATTLQTLVADVNGIKAGKTTDSRKTQLEAVLKDTSSSFRDLMVKNFERMSFADETKFTEYLTDVTEDAKGFTQSEADKALAGAGKPGAGGGGAVKEISKERAASIVGNIMPNLGR